MSHDTKITFMACEELTELIGRVSYETDRSKSEIIRACVLHSIDAIRAMPTLTNRLSIEDRKDYQSKTR